MKGSDFLEGISTTCTLRLYAQILEEDLHTIYPWISQVSMNKACAFVLFHAVLSGCKVNRIPDAFIEDWSLLGWNIPFRRVLNDQEVDRITEFFKVLDMFKGTTDAGDSMIWKGNGRKCFTLKSTYNALTATGQQDTGWP